jgi:hypothetical protein
LKLNIKLEFLKNIFGTKALLDGNMRCKEKLHSLKVGMKRKERSKSIFASMNCNISE